MAELYESYKQDFDQLNESILSKLSELASTSATNAEAKRTLLRRAEIETEEADEILGQMDLEVQVFPASIKNRYSAQMRAFRADLDKHKSEIRKHFAAINNAAYAPSDADLEGGAGTSAAQRERLLRGTATLEDGSRRLQESQRIALETEEVGAGILRDLRGQREQIENSRNTLRQADSNIDRSSRTLTQMIRRARQQKIVTAGIITVLVLLILLILYNKIF
ncbi:t-SNARE VTI1 [Tilletia horrida]|uniref:t-SNARE VTI1 n=1 Tax=Tilletia horrida TaxID=155126 RepID=A0AAN6GYL1_9BASI|nr:t-SNARE VTI1 [Tilletia horrida]